MKHDRAPDEGVFGTLTSHRLSIDGPGGVVVDGASGPEMTDTGRERPNRFGSACNRNRGEQSVNNVASNTRNHQGLSGINRIIVINWRTIFFRIPGIPGVLSELQTRRTREPRRLH